MASCRAPDLDELERSVTGGVHRPGDPTYADLSRPWELGNPSRPIAVVAVADEADVVHTVQWARANGVQLAARATGHGASDPLDGAVLVHTGALRSLGITAPGTVRAGAGVVWNEVRDVAQGVGRAPLAGSAGTVSVVGLLTGGGLGPLARSHGVGSDRVTALEVVTGDGGIRRVTSESEGEDGDLFWGIRGGKGALGVVTAVEFEMLPLPTVVAGTVFFDGAHAAAVLRRWVDWCVELPAGATTSIAIQRLPAMPGVPGPLAGRTSVAVRFAWTGEPAEADRLLAPLREVAPVLMGGIGEMPAAHVGSIHGDPEQPMPSYQNAVMLDSLPSAAVDALLEGAGPDSLCRQVVVEVRQLGGAVAAQPEIPSAFCGRDVAFTLNTVGITLPSREEVETDSRSILDRLHPWSMSRHLANFAAATDPAGVARWYDPETLQRLAAVSGRVDPDAVLREGSRLRAAAAS